MANETTNTERFVFAQTKEAFTTALEGGTVDESKIAFILDDAQLYTHGEYFQFVGPNLFYNTSENKKLGSMITTGERYNSHIVNRWQVDGETITGSGTACFSVTMDDDEFITTALPFPDPDETTWSAYAIFAGCNFYKFNKPFLKYLLIEEITSWSNAFLNCANLTTIPSGCFAGETHITDISYIFSGCTSLKSISACFASCKGITAATGALYRCYAITDATNAFALCSSITDGAAGIGTPYLTSLENAKCMFVSSGVTSAESAFKDNTTITYATSCFAGCTALTNASYAFYGCTSLTDATTCFAGCTALTNVAYAFYGCTSLPDATTCFAGCTAFTNASYAFYGCTSLTDATTCFGGCTALTTAVYAFYGCTSLPDATSCFGGCTALTTAVYTFYGCTSLTDATTCFGGCTALTTASYTFSGCTSLTDATTCFGGCTALTTAVYTFYGCTSLKTAKKAFYNFTGLSVIAQTFGGCTSLEDASYAFAASGQDNLNSTLTTADNVFYGCSSLKKALYTFAYCSTLVLDENPFIDAQETLTTCQSAFNCCYKLTDSIDSWFYGFTALTTARLAFGSCRAVTSAAAVFKDCTSLTDAIKALAYCYKMTDANNAFTNCTSLTNASYCFCGNTALTTVINTSIDTQIRGNTYSAAYYYGAFYNCPEVTNYSYCFYNCYNLTEVAADKYCAGSNNGSITIYHGIDFTNVTDSTDMFYNCTALTTLSIKNLGAAESTIKLDSKTGLQNWETGLDYTISNAYDRASAGLDNATIYLHEDVVARLSDDQITTLTDKGFTIVEMS